MENFKQLMLSEELLSAIKEAGFEKPTEIQEKTIPLILDGKDVIGSSSTGSGKTLAFAAGLIDSAKRGDGVRTLILTPTRELAEQVASTVRSFSRGKGLRIVQVYGGVSIKLQINKLRNADIVVGTPGRLLDHLNRKTINLSKVKHLVLDEADRMVDMGFIRDIEKIINYCPVDRQTLLFSATMSQDINYIAKKYMNDPVKFTSKEQIDPSKLHQVYYPISQDMKFSFLAFLLKREKNGIAMVFCNTRRNTDKLTKKLEKNNLNALAIHGGLSQNKRLEVMRAFHLKKTLILICTDVAARGLDIKDVTHIYNYDIPKTSSEYIHRIGRTARAGKNGIAISFVSSGDHGDFNQILKNGASNIEKLKLPKFEYLKVDTKQSSESKNQVKPKRNIHRAKREINRNRKGRRNNNWKRKNRTKQKTSKNAGRFRGRSNYRKR